MKKKTEKLTLAHFSICVPWANCRDVMGVKQYRTFLKWMAGQTCTPYGPFAGDVERFIKGFKVID